MKIKEHFKKNKKIYIATGVGVCVGLVSGAFAAHSTAIVQIRPIQALTWKSTQTVEVFVEALGDPGNIVQDITTGTIYASQGQAARALGINPARITENLSGKLPDIKGHVFQKLGKAHIAE